MQAEAPPGLLFNRFKELVLASNVVAEDISFYFVHWLTDLAGAEPTPLCGAEKFVLKFPSRVLLSICKSFPVVQRLATTSQTELMERYLEATWQDTYAEEPLPVGDDAVAVMRLALQAQGTSELSEIRGAVRALGADERQLLSAEMALSGVCGQSYQRSPQRGGVNHARPLEPPHARREVAPQKRPRRRRHRRRPPPAPLYASPDTRPPPGRSPRSSCTILPPLSATAGRPTCCRRSGCSPRSTAAPGPSFRSRTTRRRRAPPSR